MLRKDKSDGFVILNAVKDLLLAFTLEEKADPSLRSG